MNRWKKRSLVLAVLPFFLFTLTAVPAFAQDEEDSAEMLLIMADIIIARPLGLVVLAFGAGFFLTTLPVSAPIQEHEKMFRVFIVEPTEFTFLRPLGEF